MESATLKSVNTPVKGGKKDAPKKVRLTPENIDQIKAMHRDGYKQSDIASLLGVCVGTVSYHLKKSKRNSGRRAAITDDLRAQIVRMKKAGWPAKQVAKEHGIAQSTVYKIWSQHRKDTPAAGEIVFAPNTAVEPDELLNYPDSSEPTSALLLLFGISALSFLLGMAVAWWL